MVLARWQLETTLTETMQLFYDAASDFVFSNGNADHFSKFIWRAPAISTTSRVHAESKILYSHIRYYQLNENSIWLWTARQCRRCGRH